MAFKEEYKKWCIVPYAPEKSWFRNRGFAFEKILNACLQADGLEPRSGYKTEGEQIDGSFFLDGSVFLLEAKWHKILYLRRQYINLKERLMVSCLGLWEYLSQCLDIQRML